MKSLSHRGINTKNPLAPDEVKALSERECRADGQYKDNDTPAQSRLSSRAQLPAGSGIVVHPQFQWAEGQAGSAATVKMVITLILDSAPEFTISGAKM